MSFQKINKCRLCKSAKMTVVLPLESTPIGDDYLKVKNLKQKNFHLSYLDVQIVILFNYQLILMQMKFMEIIYM